MKQGTTRRRFLKTSALALTTGVVATTPASSVAEQKVELSVGPKNCINRTEIRCHYIQSGNPKDCENCEYFEPRSTKALSLYKNKWEVAIPA